MPILEEIDIKDLNIARGIICQLAASYERAIIVEVCTRQSIDTERLAYLRDTIATLRNILRDIASETSRQLNMYSDAEERKMHEIEI